VGNRAALGHKTSEHKCETLPPTLFTKHPRTSYSTAAVEPTHYALQRLDQKRVDEIKRIMGALEAVESPITETKRVPFLECAKELGIKGDAKLQEVLISITIDGTSDPVLTARAISPCLQQLMGKGEQYCKSKKVKAEVKEVQTPLLEYLSAGARSLEDALKRRSAVG
jgi:hypothetical protein